MKSLPFVSLIVLSCYLSGTAGLLGKGWNITGGKAPFEAEYVQTVNGVVTLKDANGKNWEIPFAKFSALDQQHLRTLQKPQTPATDTRPPIGQSSQPASKLLPKVLGKPEVVATLKPGEILTRTAAGETQTTYHIYVPTKFDAANPPPIIISFSPVGSGRGMLDTIKDSAEKAGWLLVGCDKLSNDIEGSALEPTIEDELLADITTSLPHDPNRIYLSGMSGGAHRSYRISNRVKMPFAGILAFGGWLGGKKEQQLRYAKKMTVAIVNGRNDKAANAWADGDEAALKRSQCKVKQFAWDGGHEVSPPEVTSQAMTWMDEQWKARNK